MRTYFETATVEALMRAYPIGDDFPGFASSISRDELFHRQNRLFLRCVERAWQTGFYRRLWSGVGLDKGDIRSLEDIAQLPVFDKSDLMASIEREPPFGDFAGVSLNDPEHEPMVFHTTSGTTGKPQVLLFGARSREIQNLLLARIYRLQGLIASDVVHSVYGHGMINGGHYIREAILHWTNALFMSAGTGIETPSVRQVELMRDFDATVMVGFADYLKRLAAVAEEGGIHIGKDINIRMISGQMGREDKNLVAELWGGAECYDWYGVGDTGAIAGEGPDKDGLYVMEDAHYLEILEIDTGAVAAHGDIGDIVCTCLFKDDVYPIIRFNTHDVSRYLNGASSLGWNLHRIEGFLGRSDSMIKIKGINVFPQGIGSMLEEVPEFLGEYVCKLDNGQLVVIAEVSVTGGELVSRMRDIIKRKAGIEVVLRLVGKGETAHLTEVDRRQKPIRLLQE